MLPRFRLQRFVFARTLGIILVFTVLCLGTIQWPSLQTLAVQRSTLPKATSALLKNATLHESQALQHSLRLTHVWSPYVVQRQSPGHKALFYPLNQEQNITWASLYQAQQQYRQQGGSVQIVCAILWMDVDILMHHSPPLCTSNNIVILNRSSHSEYPHLHPPIHYPFVMDLLQAPTAVARYDYLILTNADIAVVSNFYTFIQNKIQQGLDAFTINRRSISPTMHLQPLTSHDLLTIQDVLIPKGKWHPGSDCFVIQHQLVKDIDMGMLFAGHPPWASVLLNTLMLWKAQNFSIFDSEFGWTFHVGEDGNWRTNMQTELTLQQQHYAAKCLVMSKAKQLSDHWLQNAINCADIMNDAWNNNFSNLISYQARTKAVTKPN